MHNQNAAVRAFERVLLSEEVKKSDFKIQTKLKTEKIPGFFTPALPMHTSTTVSAEYVMYESAVEVLESGQVKRAERLFRRLLESFKNPDGSPHPQAGAVYNIIGAIEEQRRDLRSAEKSYSQAATVLEKAPDDIDAQRLQLQSWGNLGRVYQSMGHFAQAEKWLGRAVDIAERRVGSESIDLVDALNNRGVLATITGAFEEAYDLFCRAARIFRAHFGDVHQELATIYHNFSLLAYVRGDVGESERCVRQALKIRKKDLGQQHTEVAGDLLMLARIYIARDKLGDADQILQKALDIYEDFHGAEHFEIALTLAYLGGLRQELGKFTSAEECLQRAVTMMEHIFQEETIDYAVTLYDLATVFKRTDRVNQSVNMFRRAHDIFEKSPVLAKSYLPYFPAKYRLVMQEMRGRVLPWYYMPPEITGGLFYPAAAQEPLIGSE